MKKNRIRTIKRSQSGPAGVFGMRVTNSKLGSLKAGYKKIANSGLNETITDKLHMNSNSGTMPQTGIAGYSESYSRRFKTLIHTRKQGVKAESRNT